MSQVKTSPNDLILSLQSVRYKPCRRYFETILFGSLLTVGCITSWILTGSQDKQYGKFTGLLRALANKLIRYSVNCSSGYSNLGRVDTKQ